MSWESYYQRASGSNVDRILADMQENQRRKEELRMHATQAAQQRQFDQAQAEREAQARVQTALMARHDPEAYAWAQQHGIDIPQYAESPQEKYAREVAEDRERAWREDPNHGLAQGALEGIGYHLATGANPNEAVAQSGVRGAVYHNQATLPPEQVQAQRVADALDLSATDREKSSQWGKEFDTVKVPEARALIAKSGAEATEAGARTRKLAAETEQVGRDKQSKNPFTERRASSLNDEIKSMRTELSRYQAMLVQPDRKKFDNGLIGKRVEALTATIAAKEKQRDVLMSGQGEAYVPGMRQPSAKPRGPKIGDTMQAANGKTLYFDGVGWTDHPVD